MGIFTTREARPVVGPEASAELDETVLAQVPAGFESVGEALASGSRSVIDACWVVGRDLAEVGASLGDSLRGLRSTTRLLRGRDPSFSESQALAVSWSEGTLSFLHRLSCADPMTGLASQAHLRERLAELYREHEHGDGRRSFALVVVEAPVPDEFVGHTARMTTYGELARSVFSGSEPIGRVGVRRMVVVATRDQQLPARVALLAKMYAGRPARVWIEGLPATEVAAVHLVDELSRS